MIHFDAASYTYRADIPPAVQDISFRLEPGSFHFLCGPSGAGKTTIFKMLYLDLLPSSGSLNLFKRNAATLDRDEVAFTRRRMGIVFQDFRLLNHLTVRENVCLPLAVHGLLTPEQEAGVDEILEWVGLGQKMDESPAALSGGEQQRVAIARAVVGRPKLLIADEPTGNIDATMGKKILHLFGELHRHGTTVLIATHDRELVKSFQYPCLYLDKGRLVKVGK